MCGIVGYLGEKTAQPILLEGLKRLEYRGYDSAGIAVADENGKIAIRKRAGRIAHLERSLQENPLYGSFGIGHTRWATHGMPTDENAHPQTDESGSIAVVHNGIIENHQELRDGLQEIRFTSQTDTEVIAHLLRRRGRGSMLHALYEVTALLRGHYALAVMTESEPGKIFCVRKGSPLVIGHTAHETLLASDIPALLKWTREICFPEENEIAVLTKDGIQLYDASLRPQTPVFRHIDWASDAAEKDGHPHFMRKEMLEQPACVSRTIETYREKRLLPDTPAALDIVACGTALHAAMTGAHFFKRLAGVPVRAFPASEYRYDAPLPVPGALTLAVSQSGETADTVAALESARQHGPVAVLTNTVGSTLSRMADTVLLTCAGPEIAVASTKAYTAQLTVLLMMAMETGARNGFLNAAQAEKLHAALSLLPAQMETALRGLPALDGLSARILNARVCFFIGRGIDRPSALEGALKLREVAAQPCEAYPAGELKHGPIALVEKGVPVIAVCTHAETLEKTLMNLRETKARGAETLCICPEALAKRAKLDADTVFPLPDAPAPFMPLLSCLPLQGIAYRAAVSRGLDPDKPRNLAKSVTVE